MARVACSVVGYSPSVVLTWPSVSDFRAGDESDAAWRGTDNIRESVLDDM